MSDQGDQTQGGSSSQTGSDRPVRCPSCGTANRADARWCSNCAQPLGQAGTAPNGGSRPASTTPAPTTPPPASTTPVTPPSTQPTPSSAAPSGAAPSSTPTTPVAAARPSTPAPTTPVTPPRSPAAARQRRSNLNPLLAIATVVLLITTVIFGLMALAPSAAPIKTKSTQRAAAGNAEEGIRELASRFTENLLTYKYQTVDADFERALRDATGEFASRPLATFGGLNLTRVKADIKKGEATSTVDVKGAAITSQDSETATVLVVSTRTWDSNQRPRPAHTVAVVELTLLNTSDGWKVDNASDPASAS
jgi:hypothetical protein